MRRLKQAALGLIMVAVMIVGYAIPASATTIANGTNYYESNHSCTFRFQEGNYAGTAYAHIDSQNSAFPDYCATNSYVQVTNGSFAQISCGFTQVGDYAGGKHCRYDSATRTEQATIDASSILGGAMLVCSSSNGGGPACNAVHNFSPF